MKLYHYSQSTNLASIKENGLHVGADNVVYLAESPMLARAFAYIYGLKDYALFEVPVTLDDIEKSTDHNEDYFKKLTGELSAECYSCKHNIPADRVTFLGCYSFSD